MRTPAFRALIRTLGIALRAEQHGLSTTDAIDRWRRAGDGIDRRTFLKGLGASAVVTAAARPAFGQSTRRIAIVGAGLAGLACADRLAARGIAADVYDASARPGGRCSSLHGVFPGQAAEGGGELIDNLHKTMIGYARRYGLALEDYEKQPGDVVYHFDGQFWPESAIVNGFRAFVGAMRADLRRLSRQPTADSHQPFDVALDNLSLAEYLATRGADRTVSKAIEAAYEAEYGLEMEEQSSLNFLLFIHADKRSRFMPFGVFSDERFHVADGNDRIAEGLAGDLPAPVRYGHVLRRIARASDGRLELTFGTPGRSIQAAYDYVVAAIPFTVLRDVELAASLQLPAWKLHAIRMLGYGTNAKMMVGFDGPYWRALGSSGGSYSDLRHHQTTWETSPTRATARHAVLTDYSSGTRGARLQPHRLSLEVGRFLGDLEVVFPGAQALAARDRGAYRAHLEHWPSNPLSKGSYTCYTPGQFTTIAGNEGKRVGNLLFAGEHANSFYEWQGFMEGACLSGLAAADELLAELRRL